MAWMRKYGLQAGQRFVGLEIFAGSCRITMAHREAGLEMVDPVDTLWGISAFEEWIDELILSGRVQWLWLAPPYSNFSPLRSLERGGPLRPAGNPEGDPSQPAIALGNCLWERALHLVDLMLQVGGFFVIEHPRRSRAWSLRVTELFSGRGVACKLKVDWCAFCESNTPEPPLKKPTVLYTNAPWVSQVVKLCPRDHQHAAPLRGKRAKAAEAYPEKFCQVLADACREWTAGRSPQ